MKLAEIVYKQLSCDDVKEFHQVCSDVCKGGANAGFSGFTYHLDCEGFIRDNLKVVIEAYTEYVDDVGEWSMPEDIRPAAVLAALHTDGDNAMTISRLAWWCLETVALHVADLDLEDDDDMYDLETMISE